MRDRLDEYADKRDFRRTAEPSNTNVPSSDGPPRFVPIEYLDFEGTIPEDEYGGGSVIVWDIGTWENCTTSDGEPVSAADAVEAGHISFRVDGTKLRGGYTLQHFRDDDQWLLIKQDDEEADARRRPTSTQPESVISGHPVDEISEVAARDQPDDDDGAEEQES